MVDSDLAELYQVETPGASPGGQTELEPLSGGLYVSAFQAGGRGYAITNCDRMPLTVTGGLQLEQLRITAAERD
jgi:hypothetical protein